MAISANGIIATKSGSEDFLSHDNWTEFSKLANKVGCIVWGRKTYEEVITWGDGYLNDLKNVTKVILTKSDIALSKGFIKAASPENAIQVCESKGFKKMIITGGATLNKEFAIRNLIDEVILDINAVIVGEGIPVFSNSDFQMKLSLLESKKVSDNVFELRYKVIKD